MGKPTLEQRIEKLEVAVTEQRAHLGTDSWLDKLRGTYKRPRTFSISCRRAMKSTDAGGLPTFKWQELGEHEMGSPGGTINITDDLGTLVKIVFND